MKGRESNREVRRRSLNLMLRVKRVEGVAGLGLNVNGAKSVLHVQ